MDHRLPTENNKKAKFFRDLKETQDLNFIKKLRKSTRSKNNLTNTAFSCVNHSFVTFPCCYKILKRSPKTFTYIDTFRSLKTLLYTQ